MTEGLTTTGLVVDTTDQTLAKIEADELATIDSALNTAPTQPVGQLNGIFASQRSDVAQLAQADYAAIDPGGAEGQQLDVLCAITGTTRESAKSTLVIAQCSLDKGHVFAIATRDANGNVTANGDLVANIAGHPEFVFTFVAQSDPTGGVLYESLDTTTASGTLSYNLVFECAQTGPIACNAGTLTAITLATAGFNSITNSADAYRPGAPIETDTALRVRRKVELVPAGGGTIDSLRRSVGPVDSQGNGVAGVISAQVLFNDDDVTDGNGLPPHSFACIIWDGTVPAASNSDIAQAIWNAKPAGIKAFEPPSGGQQGTAVDSAGGSHTVGFARATQDALYIAISVKIDSTKFPSDGDAQIAAALVAEGNALGVGGEVELNELASVCLERNGGVAGVRTFSLIKCDTNAVPVNTADIATASSHIARFDVARVAVTHV